MPKFKLKALRINAGYTQEQLAELIGVSLGTIKNWERGKTFPKQPMIEKLCELYKIPYDFIEFV